MAAYKHLIFDLDDTILDFRDTEEKALEKTMAHFHLPYTEQTVGTYKKSIVDYGRNWNKERSRETKFFLLVFLSF